MFSQQCFCKKKFPGAGPGRAREGDTRVFPPRAPPSFRALYIFYAPASQARVIINTQLPPSFGTVDVSYMLGPGTILKI